MGFTREDKENRKFETDPSDSSKVVVKTKVENTDSDAVPVKIINTDANIDVEVSVPSTISIDDSTPIDVAVTGTPNVSVTNTPSVTVSGQVDLDDATAVRVDVTNAAVATNATIQNSSLNTNATIQGTADVNVTNSNINAYSYVHDGAQWRFQLADSTGRAINLDHTYYSGTEITSLGSSTDINLWLSAYNDSMLQLKFVETYNNEHEETVYYQHPSLGNGTKCLRLIFQYSTENSQVVVKSIHASVSDWSYTDDIEGSVSISAGAITSPNPNSDITIHTVVTTLTITDNTVGGVTLSLSGTNASLYHLHEVETGTHSQTTLTYVAGRTYQVHAHSNFGGADYSHSITVTATGDIFGVSDSVNIATSGTFTGGGGGAFSNDNYLFVEQDGNAGAVESETISRDFTQDFSISFWCKMAPFNYSYQYAFYFGARRGTTRDSLSRYDAVQVQYRGHATNNYIVIGTAYTSFNDPGLDDNNWHCVVLTYDGSGLSGTDTLTTYNIASRFKFYVDGSLITQSTYFSSPNSFAMSTTMTNFRIGDFVSGTTEHDYNIDEFAYWTAELTSTEVGLIYNSGTVADLQNTTGLTVPTRYWRYEDSSNLTKDTISDSNQGTITNSGSGGQQSY